MEAHAPLVGGQTHAATWEHGLSTPGTGEHTPVGRSSPSSPRSKPH